jgi:hypothetical protein
VADNYRNIPLGADARQYTPNSDDVNDSTTATGFTAATGNAGSRWPAASLRDKQRMATGGESSPCPARSHQRIRSAL